MFELMLGSMTEFHDGPAVPVEAFGALTKFHRPATGEYETLHASQLPLRLKEPPTLDDGLAKFSSLDDVSAEKLNDLASHLREVLHGSPRGLEQSVKSTYNPEETTLTQRVEEKVKELESLGTRMSKATLFRKIAAYRAGGTAALVDGRTSKRSRGAGSSVDTRVREALAVLIAKHTNRATVTINEFYRLTRKEVMVSHRGEQVPFPSETTFRRLFHELDGGQYTLGSSKTRRSQRSRPKRLLAGRTADVPGGEVQVDSTPLDVLVRTEDNQVERVNLTLAVDKATRSILGFILVPVATKSVDLSFLLAQCLVPRQLRPGPSKLLTRQVPTLPWAALFEEETLRLYETARPFIVPRRIMVDNGKDFVSRNVQSTCEQLGISVTQAAIRTGSDKGIVERANETIKTMVIEKLPGYTGGDVSSRGTHPELDNGLLDIFALNDILERWITVVYQNTLHESLRDPWRPKVQHTPNSMYAALFTLTGAVPVPLSEKDYISFLPIVDRAIGPTGIQYGYRRYDSVQLHPYRDNRDARTGKKKAWEVRFYPYDPSYVWVADPETGEWITCGWMDGNVDLRPFNATIHSLVPDYQRRYGALDKAEAHAVGGDLIDETVEQTKKRSRATRRAAAAAERHRVLPVEPEIHLAQEDEVEGIPDGQVPVYKESSGWGR